MKSFSRDDFRSNFYKFLCNFIICIYCAHSNSIPLSHSNLGRTCPPICQVVNVCVCVSACVPVNYYHFQYWFCCQCVVERYQLQNVNSGRNMDHWGRPSLHTLTPITRSHKEKTRKRGAQREDRLLNRNNATDSPTTHAQSISTVSVRANADPKTRTLEGLRVLRQRHICERHPSRAD